ncbi:hypothetical protein [Nocardia mexicana]|uniref:Uncharacterized protein n=1 Tax=Nocardia mexicana TaxID=279262 RepID=A0A370H508_9NOCA|nr:hypothetical protein [Nocardia mexicana]RDI50858.1 hypothetical protein DFR68_105335 [Nocardia mexicana]
MNEATVENRLRGLETFAQNTAVDLADIKSTQREHTESLAQHGETLARHTTELADIKATQARHSEALDALALSVADLKREGDARHTATTTMLQAVLDRLP